MSEKNFIATLYNYMVDQDSSKEEKEKLARIIVRLHKIYWHGCELDSKEVSQESK